MWKKGKKQERPSYNELLKQVEELQAQLQAQEALANSIRTDHVLSNFTEHNKALLMALPDTHFIHDKEGRFVDVHASESSPLLFPESQIIGKNPLEVLPPDLAIEIINTVKRVIKTKKLQIYSYPLNINDIEYWFEARLVPFGDDHVFSLIRNISEERKAKEKLQESEARYRSLFKNNYTVMLLIDPETGQIMDANKAAVRFYGYAYKEILTLNISTINTEQPPQLKEDLANATLRPQNFQFKHRLASGEIKDVEVYSGPIFVQGRELLYSSIFDISEKKQVENKAHQLNALLNYSLEQSPAIILITDKSGQVQYANKIATEFLIPTHNAPKEINLLEPNPFWKLFDHDGRLVEDNNRPMRQALVSEKTTWNREYKIVSRDGSSRWVLVNATPTYFNNQLSGSIAVFWDISSIKKHERELVHAKEQAEESDRLKSAFLANMSHEIRTPMNSIIGFASMLNDPEHTNSRDRFVQIIQKNGHALLYLINEIIDLSKIEAGILKLEPKEANLFQLMEELESNYQIHEIILKRKLQIISRSGLQKDAAYCLIDYKRLQQIYRNLIDNAIKFTHSGIIEFGYEITSSQELRGWVKDTGTGIPEAQQQKIFERFHQIDSSTYSKNQGTGLGLSITKALVELMGGEIFLESRPGHGSLFSFQIPYFPKTSTPNHETNRLKTNIPMLTGKKILIIEDVEDNYLLLAAYLNQTHGNITWAKSGHEALEYIENKDKPDLVLLDIKLPDINGFVVLETLRNKYPDLLVIAQTAYAMDHERQKLLDAGCNGYLSKPIVRDDLFDTISNLLP